MRRSLFVVAALALTLLASASPASAHTAVEKTSQCASFHPESDFYEAGRVGTEEITTPTSNCTTISVSNVRDAADPTDRCQTFLVGFWPLVDGSLTYTEPVTACGAHQTVLARNVPDNTHYLVIYVVDYIDPDIQMVNFRVWH